MRYLLYILLLMPRISGAFTAANSGNNYALFFVGTKNLDTRWVPVPEARSEAGVLAKELRDSFGFFCEIFENKTKDEIRAILVSWRNKIGEQDQLLLFFSMHGALLNDNGYLIPADGLFNDHEKQTWLSYTELRELVRPLQSLHLLLLLDACHSGAFPPKYKGGPSNDDESPRPIGNSRPNPMQHYSRQYFSACDATEKVEHHSEFVERLLEALRAGGNRGVVRTADILHYLRYMEKSKAQFGTFEGHDEAGDFVFKKTQTKPPGIPYTPNPNPQKIIPNYIPEVARLLDGTNYAYIPGGEFSLGAVKPAAGDLPFRNVQIPDMYLGKREVSNAAYCVFLNQCERSPDGLVAWINLTGSQNSVRGSCRIRFKEGQFTIEKGFEDHPVTYVSWTGAVAYCDWLSRQSGDVFRLPSEDEWEYVAGNGFARTLYSWGNGNPTSSLGGNVADESARKQYSFWSVFRGFDDGYVQTAPTGSFAPNDFDVYNMTGNVLEWCIPTQKLSQDTAVAKGGAWDTAPDGCQVTKRFVFNRNMQDGNTGFRVVRVPATAR